MSDGDDPVVGLSGGWVGPVPGSDSVSTPDRGEAPDLRVWREVKARLESGLVVEMRSHTECMDLLRAMRWYERALAPPDSVRDTLEEP